MFFTGALPFIPHLTTLCLPARGDSQRKRWNGKSGMTSSCGHNYHLLLLKVSRGHSSPDLTSVTRCMPRAIQASFGVRQFKGIGTAGFAR